MLQPFFIYLLRDCKWFIMFTFSVTLAHATDLSYNDETAT